MLLFGVMSISSASWIVMAQIIAQFHDTAIAGYQVAIRLIVFFILPAWGITERSEGYERAPQLC